MCIRDRCRGRQRFHGDHRLLDAVGIELRIRDLKVDDGIDLHGDVILRDNGLRGIVQYLLLQADAAGDALDERQLEVDADLPHLRERTEALDDVGAGLLHLSLIHI